MYNLGTIVKVLTAVHRLLFNDNDDDDKTFSSDIKMELCVDDYSYYVNI